MTLREELEPYMFSPGLVSHRKVLPHEKYPKSPNDDPTGNGIMYSCLGLIVANDNGEQVYNWVNDFHFALNCCTLDLGLYMRTPRKPDQQGQDDYLWLAAYHREIAENICWYGENVKGKLLGLPLFKYNFNTEKPGQFSWSAWLGRYPQLVAHFNACAGNDVPKSFAKQWANNMYLSAKKDPKDQDAWLHAWALHRHPPKYDFCERAAQYWRGYVLNEYGSKWAQGIAARCLDPEHPIGLKFIF